MDWKSSLNFGSYVSMLISWGEEPEDEDGKQWTDGAILVGQLCFHCPSFNIALRIEQDTK